MSMSSQNKGKIVGETPKIINGSSGSGSGLRGWLSSFWAIGLLFACVAILLLPMKNVAMLRWYEEMSFFSPDMLELMLMHPGGFIDYCGLFLTQFMFYPWLGSFFLLALWIAEAFVVSKAFGLKGLSTCWAYLPSFCMLLSVLSFDETWISLRSFGSLFSPALGLLAATLAVWAYRAVSGWIGKTILVVVVALLYPFFGFYSVLAVAACVLCELSKVISSRSLRGLIPAFAGVVSMAAVPVFYFYNWNGTIADNDNLYIKGLPGFRTDDIDSYLWIPFAILTALFAVYAIWGRRLSSSSALGYVGIGLFAVFGAWSFHASDRISRQLRSTVAMLRYIDHNQWEHVGYVMSHSNCSPNLYMALYDNMSRQKLGLGMTGREIAPSDKGNGNPRRSEELIGTVFLTIPANYQLGKANSSYRWAMENTVAYGVSVFYLKYMVRTALCNGEYKLAEKYNDMLLGTMFHGYWAEHYKKYIDNPELLAGSAEFSTIPQYEPDVEFLQDAIFKH